MDVKLRLPFSGNHRIITSFGASAETPEMAEKYVEWKITGHNGVDFAMPEGSAVCVVDDGVVVQSGLQGDLGNTVTIKHSWGRSLYAHLGNIVVELQKNVERGDLIAFSGMTGMAHEPHLHFGIKLDPANPNNGYHGFVDPLPYLPSLKIPSTNAASPLSSDQLTIDVQQEAKKLLLSYLQQAQREKKRIRSERVGEVYAFIQEHGKTTHKELHAIFPKLSRATITNYTNILEKQGKIKQHGTRKQAYYQVVI